MVQPRLLDLPKHLETKHLIIRSYKIGEGQLLIDALQHNKEHLRKALPEGCLDIQDPNEVEALVQKLITDWEMRKKFYFGIWEKIRYFLGSSFII